MPSLAGLVPLFWGVFGISCLLILDAGIAAASRRSRLSGFTLGLCLATVVIGAIGFLPTRDPWSPGQGLLWGWLLGGPLLLLAVWLGLGADWPRSLASCAGCAALGVSTLALFASPSLPDALLGMGLGSIIVALLLNVAEPESDPTSAALAMIAVASTTFLALRHRDAAGARPWTVLPILWLVATGGVGAALRARVRSTHVGPSLFLLGGVGIAAAVALGLQLQGGSEFAPSLLIGALAAGVGQLSDRRAALNATQAALLGGAVALGGAAAAYRGLHGYGIGLAALAAWIVAGAGNRSDPAPGARVTAAMLTTLALHRCWVELGHSQDDSGNQAEYVALGLLLGVLLPPLLAALAPDLGRSGAAERAVTALGLAAAAACAAPAIWLLVGGAPQTSLLLGATLGAAIGTAIHGRASSRVGVAILVSLLAVMAATLITPVIEPLALKTRAERMTALALLGSLITLAAGCSAFGAARAGKGSGESVGLNESAQSGGTRG